ncbi:hypothetical protein D3C80_1131650 [compost metagenome]
MASQFGDELPQRHAFGDKPAIVPGDGVEVGWRDVTEPGRGKPATLSGLQARGAGLTRAQFQRALEQIDLASIITLVHAKARAQRLDFPGGGVHDQGALRWVMAAVEQQLPREQANASLARAEQDIHRATAVQAKPAAIGQRALQAFPRTAAQVGGGLAPG